MDLIEYLALTKAKKIQKKFEKEWRKWKWWESTIDEAIYKIKK